MELQGKKPTRHGFGEGLVVLGERHDNVVVLGGDITGSVMTSLVQGEIPGPFLLDRYRRAECDDDR